MTFVVYLFAVSIFFFAIDEVYFSKQPELDINYDLMFSKLSNVYDEYSFLENSKIRTDFDSFLNTYDPELAYEKYFQSFESVAFSRIDYCIYLQNDSGIIINFNVNKTGYYPIFITGDVECGTNPSLVYTDVVPECKSDDAVVYAKPVLFKGEIVDLKVLACGERA